MEREVAFDWPIWDALNRVTSEGVLIYVNKQTNDWKLVSVSGIQHIPLSLYTSKFQFVGRKFHMAKAQFLNNWMLRFSMLRTTRNNISSCMKWEVPFDWPISDALNRVTSVGVSIYRFTWMKKGSECPYKGSNSYGSSPFQWPYIPRHLVIGVLRGLTGVSAELKN